MQIKNDKLLLKKDIKNKRRFMNHFIKTINNVCKDSFLSMVYKTTYKKQFTCGCNYSKLIYLRDNNIKLLDSDWYKEYNKEHYFDRIMI